MKLTALKRIIVEDFDKDNQDLVQKIALLFNPIIDQLTSIMDKRIDFINVNRQLKIVTIRVNATGAPSNTLLIKSELKSKAVGIICLRVENQSNNTFPTSSPLISFSEDQGILNISNITNLAINTDYRLTLEIIGDAV